MKVNKWKHYRKGFYIIVACYEDSSYHILVERKQQKYNAMIKAEIRYHQNGGHRRCAHLRKNKHRMISGKPLYKKYSVIPELLQIRIKEAKIYCDKIIREKS